jgi:phospho-N-acetylmuramoyl-pentapeptide-transferase
MFYFLHPLKEFSIVFNLFRYITFRSAAAGVTAFLICVILGPRLILWLKGLSAMAHQKREHAEKIHQLYSHKNTPTMGGILIIASVVISMVLWGNYANRFTWLLLFVTVGFGTVGFLDDWIKLKSKSSRGLSSRTKMYGQLVLSAMLGSYLYVSGFTSPLLYLPFLKAPLFSLGILFVPFVVFVLVGSSNALNLTDGLDGLAIGCTLFAVAAFAVISYVSGHVQFAQYLAIPYIPDAGEITVFCSALAGACAGFLWFNSYPAEVIMGDTGSLALGGALGAVAVLIKKELVLAIVGGVFVWEAVSVIMQVTSFKMFKKRIFLMSPFHHHLQLKGWPESKVTVRLWIIAMVLAVVGLSTLKVR